jgi:hypothetical protein
VDEVHCISYTKKAGFTYEDATVLLTAIKQNTLSMMSEHTKTIISRFGLNQLMGSIYPFILNRNFLIGCYDNDVHLQQYLIEFVKEAFSATLTYAQLRSIIPKFEFNYQILLDCLAYGSKINHSSLYRKNMNNLIYIREKKQNRLKLFHIPIDEKEKSDFVSNTSSRALAHALTFYDIHPNSDFACIMDMFGRKYLAGPSGTAVLINILLFDLVKIPNTPLNKALLLAWVIVDYIPYYHTLPEILLTFTYEMPPSMGPKYTLEQDPVQYTLNLLKIYANISFNKQISVKPMYAHLDDSDSDS